MTDEIPIHKATEELGPIKALCDSGGYQLADKWENVTCSQCLNRRGNVGAEAGAPFQQNPDGSWSPAIPLPLFISFGRKMCCYPSSSRDSGWCERKFWRTETYELHYRIEHQKHQTRSTTPDRNQDD